ncbi:cupredoxin domain-containing protein [Egbenema bharatensis]|uniref:cupredoxin domain-containing protein n=1 Tax=Egbenema bharatensis TaxID=3463334 RepID=UPI003A836505
MQKHLPIILGWILALLVWGTVGQTEPIAQAAPAPSQQELITVQVHLGNGANELKFEPNQLEFEAGKRYKLVLDNPSNVKHYFTAKDFADVIWSQKVEAGNVEVKGAIHELELKPGAVAEWVLIPLKPGTYELHCSVAGHAEAGMRGTIHIS